MRWLVADTTYNDAARWCGHLDSYSHYLRESGEDVTVADLRMSPSIATSGWDVLYVLDRWMDMAAIPARLRVAQIAADVRPYPWECRNADGSPAYGLIMSAVPWMVAAARMAGCNAHLVPLAFDPRARVAGMDVDRDLDLVHVGTVGPSHVKRAAVLAELGSRVVSVQGFGREYFRTLARAKAVLNVHAEWSRGAMMNMRVYEALGMGCNLVTDGRPPEWLIDFEIEEPHILGCAAYSGLAAAHVLERETYVERIPQILQLVREAMP